MFAMRMTGMLQVEKLFYQVSFWYIDAETMKFCKLRIGIVAGCQNDHVAVPVALCEEVAVLQYNVHRYKAMNKVVWIVCLVLTERTEGRDFIMGITDSSSCLSPIAASVLLSTIAISGICLPAMAFIISSFISVYFTSASESWVILIFCFTRME